MELIPARSQQSYCQNGASVCSPLNLAVTSLKETVQKINELCNLPDLEITPISKNSNKKSVTDSNERSTSLEAETSRENSLKEKNDMENLLKRLPILNQYFHLHNKIGEGSFSTVYLATLRNSNATKNYAVKHLTQNCQQLRIEGELRCMTEIGGKDNVVHADYCLTSGDGTDCVTFIMPYLPHKKFSDYVLDMNADETRLYMKNLFIALRRVHSFNIIHRDVKPGNFLYNRETKQFLLVDFGLAQVVQSQSQDVSDKETVFADENIPIDYSKKRKRKDSVSDKEKTTPIKRSKRMALKSKENNGNVCQILKKFGNINFFNSNVPVPVANNTEKLDLKSPVKQFPNKSGGGSDKTPLKSRVLNTVNCCSTRRKKLFEETSPDGKDGFDTRGSVENQQRLTETGARRASVSSNSILRDKSFTPLVSSKSSSASFVQIRNSRVVRQCDVLHKKTTESFQKPKSRTPCVSEQCSCTGRGAICAICSSRNKMVAPRAGTPGFRPPEVLLKYINQTTAVDMWASGVILLCILSGCYPFFRSPNDFVALAEIMTVFGTEPIIKIAAKFGRRVVCSHQKKGVDLKKMCKLLRSRTAKKYGSSNVKKSSSGELKCDDCLQSVTEAGCLCISENLGELGENQGNDLDYGFPDSAFDLLKRLLDLDPSTRITAAEALEHPFILGD